MWIERVEALSFGPFSEEILELGEGMTLIYGPNEAGKSSWSAALYAGVCGVRRGRGRPRPEDESFERLHRPWSGGPWRVRAVVALTDGRRVELDQDLASRTGSARDLTFGRDVTSEILTEQSPDASVWLGLDRTAFRAVAWVAQGSMLEVRQHPERIAEHLQRAAATVAVEATAAEAIALLDDYIAEYVGTERAATRPLARAIAAVGSAAVTLENSHADHEALAELRQELQASTTIAANAAHQLHLLEAAILRHQADAFHQRLEEASDLQGRVPAAPPALPQDDALAQQVSIALSAWRDRPDAPTLEGKSAAEFEAELNALPEAPMGDLEPSAAVDGAFAKVRDARAALNSLTRLEPASMDTIDPSFDAPELRRLAEVLDDREPEEDAELLDRVASVRGQTSPRAGSIRFRAAVVLAGVLVVAGVIVGGVAHRAPGWALVGLGALLGIALGAARRASRARQSANEEALRSAESELSLRTAARAQVVRRRSEALTRAAELGFEDDPAMLREIAQAADRAAATAQQRSDWQRQRNDAEADLATAIEGLRRVLVDRGVRLSDDLDADVLQYRQDCSERARLAQQAARRPDLEANIASRRRAEEQTADVKRRREATERAVQEAARSCGYPEPEAVAIEGLVDGLEAWMERRASALEVRDQAAEDHARLQGLLGDRTLDDLRLEAERVAELAAQRAEGLDADELGDVELGEDDESRVSALRDGAAQRATDASVLAERLRVQSLGVVDVPEAEERLASAEAELARLRTRSRILGCARDLLAQAQEGVHRSIAPQLAAAIAPRLRQVTSERYTEVIVDPENLEVRVRARKVAPGARRRYFRTAQRNRSTYSSVPSSRHTSVAPVSRARSCSTIRPPMPMRCARSRYSTSFISSAPSVRLSSSATTNASSSGRERTSTAPAIASWS